MSRAIEKGASIWRVFDVRHLRDVPPGSTVEYPVDCRTRRRLARTGLASRRVSRRVVQALVFLPVETSQ